MRAGQWRRVGHHRYLRVGPGATRATVTREITSCGDRRWAWHVLGLTQGTAASRNEAMRLADACLAVLQEEEV